MSIGPFDSTPRFAHDRLDAYRVAREALVASEAIARGLPRGHSTLADQLRRALLSALLNVAEAASRSGADRLARFRIARGETSEAAAALDAAQVLRLATNAEVQPVAALLGRLYAMLTGLAKAGRLGVAGAAGSDGGVQFTARDARANLRQLVAITPPNARLRFRVSCGRRLVSLRRHHARRAGRRREEPAGRQTADVQLCRKPWPHAGQRLE